MSPTPNRPHAVPILVLIVVLVIAAGTTTFVLVRDGGSTWTTLSPPSSASPSLPVAWRIETDRSDYPDDYIGWDVIAKKVQVYDGDLVRVGKEDVSRTDPASGRVVWRTQVPEHDQVCMVSLGPARVVALTYSVRPKRCYHLAVYDLDNGELVRNTELSPVETGAPTVDALDDAVYLSHPSDFTSELRFGSPATVTRTDARTGREIWRAELAECFVVEDIRVTSARLLALVRCAGADHAVDPYWQLVALDPESGNQQWVSSVEPGEYLPLLISVDPLVLGYLQVDHACCYRQWFARLDDHGEEMFDLGRDEDAKFAAGMSRHWFSRYDTRIFTAVGSTMIIGAWADGNASVHDRQLVGIDISTGHQRWRTSLPEHGSPELVRTEGAGQVFVLNKIGRELYRLDAGTGRTELVGTLDDRLAGGNRASAGFLPVIVGDTLVLTPQTLEYGLRAIAFRLPG